MGNEGVPGNISKGPGHVAVDRMLNYKENGVFVHRPAIREALADPNQKYMDILRSLLNVPEVIASYIGYHWYPEDTTGDEVWWKDKQPIEPIARMSTIEAIDLADDLPIDSYWMPIGHRNISHNHYPATGLYRTDEYPFEVIFTKSEHQLTRVMLTPPCPLNQNASAHFTKPSDIWVMRATRDPSLLGDERVDRDAGTKLTQLYESANTAST